jgi:NmrA-like family
MSITAVAIAGVTGKLGRLVAAGLLAIPNVTVHGICRNPSKLPAELSSNPRFHSFQAECHEANKLRLAIRGTSVCVCCYLGDLAAVFLEGQKTLIDACVEEKVARYVPSNFNFDFRRLKVGDIPLKDHQVKIKMYLEEREEKGLIKAVHVLCGVFLESLFAPYFPVYDGKTGTMRVWGTGKEVLEMTTYSDAARFVAAIAVDHEAFGFLGCESNPHAHCCHRTLADILHSHRRSQDS